MSSARIISAYEKEVSIKRWRPLGFYPFNGAVSANDSAVDAVDAGLDVGKDGIPRLDEGSDAVGFQLVGDSLEVDAQLSERERRPHAQQERLWDPDRLSAEDLESFTSIFPADLMEKVYEVIVECDYDLDRAYKEVCFGGINERS